MHANACARIHLEQGNAKRHKHKEPAFDANPKLPGDSNSTCTIMTRLWNDSRKRKRPTIDEHARIQGIHVGNGPKEFAVQTRGASSERVSKSLNRANDMHAIQRLIEHKANTASSGSSRNVARGRCSPGMGPE